MIFGPEQQHYAGLAYFNISNAASFGNSFFFCLTRCTACLKDEA